MPIRWRLTLWFALILCVILILSGIVLHFLLQRYLNNQVDDNLRVHSARIHGTLNPQEIPDPLDYDVIHAKLPPINEFATPGLYIQFIDQNGNVVVKSDSLGEQELPVNPSLLEKGFAGEVVIEAVAAGDGAKVRIMVSPLRLKDQVLLLEVAQSLNPIDATMSQVRWALITSILVALTLAAVSGGMMVRSALSPVSQITRTARSIETSTDLARRVGYHGPKDEIGQLAATFDQMIEHLHQVFQSQKHFVADASHELRGPLTVIRGNLDLLKRNLSEPERGESIRVIETEIVSMAKIVSDLLTLAEVESGQSGRQELVSLKEILSDEIERVKSLAGNHGINIGRQENLEVKGDAQKLKQLLGNLVDNAARYTPQGSTITLSLYRDGEWACLEVTDNGPGIAPEHLPHIFDRFYRVDKARSRASGGTGLGLAIVKGIAEQHRGRVTVTSELGKGSTFTVWLGL
ncbi:MAG: HAMP domain-containing protein [Chloroflexi bacterium]|nr:HAMP domain-containing protein [Chloroflexota bacterium]